MLPLKCQVFVAKVNWWTESVVEKLQGTVKVTLLSPVSPSFTFKQVHNQSVIEALCLFQLPCAFISLWFTSTTTVSCLTREFA